MGHKNVCLSCKKAYSMGTNFHDIREANCPECGQPMTLVSHRFRPPKKTDDKKWEVVRFYLSNGFRYQHIQDSEYKSWVPYPEDIRGAREFVLKYKHLVRT